MRQEYADIVVFWKYLYRRCDVKMYMTFFYEYKTVDVSSVNFI